MKKLLRLFLFAVLFGLVILAGVLTMKTLAFSSKQIPVESTETPEAPAGAVQRLAEAVRFPTVSSDIGADTAAFQKLDSFIRQTYPLVDSLLELTLINRFSRLYRWAGQNAQLPPVLLMGHLDVVPVEEAARSNWTVPPFAGEQKDGFIWGRGTLDDKVACFALLEAVEQLLHENYTPGRTVYLAFGHDEEVSGRQGAMAIAEYLQRQGARFEYILDEGQIVIQDGLTGLDRPLAMIGIAEKGYVTLRLTARLAEGGHSSMPPRETAVGLLSKAVDRLQTHPFPAKINGATLAMFQHAGPEMSLPYRVLFSNLWLTGGLVQSIISDDPAASALIRTTTAPTMIQGGVKDNVLPTEASATVNFRILPGETIESVQNYVRRTVADTRVAVDVLHPEFAANPSPVSSTRSFGFQVIQKTVQQLFPDAVVAPSLVIGATDSRHYQALSDHIYRFLPVQLLRADLSRIHGIDERIGEDNYRRAIRFYRQLVVNSCR